MTQVTLSYRASTLGRQSFKTLHLLVCNAIVTKDQMLVRSIRKLVCSHSCRAQQ